jgi:hypothetical protein
VEPVPEPLHLYGQVSEREPPDWAWVDAQLRDAGIYWVVPRGHGHPHTRPVWGVWSERSLYLSVGSPIIARALQEDPMVTVHLASGTDVVIVEGRVTGPCIETQILAQYDAKYDWSYTIDEYGPLTSVAPSTVLAWRSTDWAGRGGFTSTGRFRLA